MTKPAYTIGRDELLIVTVEYVAGHLKGQKHILETEVRCYGAAEVQNIIDSFTTADSSVFDVEVYDFKAKKGMSIADDFDVRSHKERVTDDRRDLAADDNLSLQVAYNAMRNSFSPAGAKNFYEREMERLESDYAERGNPIVHGAVIGRLEAAE